MQIVPLLQSQAFTAICSPWADLGRTLFPKPMKRPVSHLEQVWSQVCRNKAKQSAAKHMRTLTANVLSSLPCCTPPHLQSPLLAFYTRTLVGNWAVRTNCGIKTPHGTWFLYLCTSVSESEGMSYTPGPAGPCGGHRQSTKHGSCQAFTKKCGKTQGQRSHVE